MHIYSIPGVPPILLAGYLYSPGANDDPYGGIFFSHVFLENRDGGLYVNRAVGSRPTNEPGYLFGLSSR